MHLHKIISGGQTGVDRAALDAALELDIPCGGWCPKGRLAEGGIIPTHYPLNETGTAEYAERTYLNAHDSDGTLIIAFGKLAGGTAFTLECAKKLNKPYFILRAKNKAIPLNEFWSWINEHKIRTLNVAGPRENQQSGAVYQQAKKLLLSLLNHCRLKSTDLALTEVTVTRA